MGSNMDKIFIVMEYVEHDLKALMETMPQPFLQGGWRGVCQTNVGGGACGWVLITGPVTTG